MYFAVDSLINIDKIITGSNNISLGKCNLKPSGFEKMYMDKDLRKDKLYQLVDQYNERKINYKDFDSEFLNNIHLMMGMEGLARYYLLANISIVQI